MRVNIICSIGSFFVSNYGIGWTVIVCLKVPIILPHILLEQSLRSIIGRI